MKKYEYLTKYFDVGIINNNINDEKYKDIILNNLNELGNNGWELVTCTPISSHAGTFVFIAFFKREK